MTDDEIDRKIKAWQNGDSNDEEIDGLTEIVRELQDERSSLYKLARAYLERCGWYWDEEHFVEVWEHPSSERDQRTYHCWTVPQWGEYWSSDHLDPVGEKPKKRRYEDFWQAFSSQVLREEEPETYATFFELEVVE